MNEELQKALADVINKASSGIDTASDFIMAELPEVVQQALTWYMVESAIYSALGLMIVASSIFMAKIVHKICRKQDDYGFGDCGEPLFLAYSVPALAFFIGASFINLDWLKIWIAPKLWLIEYAAKLAG